MSIKVFLWLIIAFTIVLLWSVLTWLPHTIVKLHLHWLRLRCRWHVFNKERVKQPDDGWLTVREKGKCEHCHKQIMIVNDVETLREWTTWGWFGLWLSRLFCKHHYLKQKQTLTRPMAEGARPGDQLQTTININQCVDCGHIKKDRFYWQQQRWYKQNGLKPKLAISVIFKWYDLWVGFFYDRHNKWLYFLPLPMIGVIFKFGFDPMELIVSKAWSRKLFGYCPHCKNIFKYSTKPRRMNTMYVNDESNWTTECSECFEETEDHWDEMWEQVERPGL